MKTDWKLYVPRVSGAPQLKVHTLVLAAIENNRVGATFSTSHNEACQIEISFIYNSQILSMKVQMNWFQCKIRADIWHSNGRGDKQVLFF